MSQRSRPELYLSNKIEGLLVLKDMDLLLPYQFIVQQHHTNHQRFSKPHFVLHAIETTQVKNILFMQLIV